MSRYFTRIGDDQHIAICKVGNKAWNLHKIMKECSARIPQSVSLNVHMASERGVAIDELFVEVRTRFEYPIIARSSSSVEDSDSSFAGQFLSKMCSNDNELTKGIQEIVDSVDSENVKAYCKCRGINVGTIKMAVLIQQYLSPKFAGVLFTKHPIDQNDSVYVEYKSNSTDAVTSGEAKVSSMLLPRNGAIDDLFFLELRDIAIVAEGCFGYPLDIEWIVSGNKLWVVQVRKITA